MSKKKVSAETQPTQEGSQQQALFVTTQSVLEGVLQYLGKQPYLEVAHMIDALKQSKPFNPPVRQGEKEDEE